MNWSNPIEKQLQDRVQFIIQALEAVRDKDESKLKDMLEKME